MPTQKPGRSKQNYVTPVELLNRVQERLCIEQFTFDLAADADNAVCPTFYTEEDNALSADVSWYNGPGWAWCNPPYANIAPWVEKAAKEADRGTQIIMLVPASVGSNWWSDWVLPYAYITHLNGRIKFVECKDYYPKDCSLLLYTPYRFTGSDTWAWQRSMSELHEPELSKD
jgi:phage N-6-adenine-methyltransferase